MTNKEALEMLENAKPANIEMLDALCLAVMAIEKQIPKKPISKKKTTPAGTHIYKCCPICDDVAGLEFNYCDNCGQRFDWSE